MKTIENYPDRIYSVQGSGTLFLYYRVDINKLKTKPNLNYGVPYECIAMLEMPDDNEGWRLRDYESFIQDDNRLIFYSQLSLGFINKMLNAESIEVWTLDIEDAIKISKERYAEHFPTGPVYDVVRYWDDCERTIIRDCLLRSEAQQLCSELNKKRKIGTLYSYSVEIHK